MKLSLEIIESKEGVKEFLLSWKRLEDSQQSLFYQRALYFSAYCEYLMPSSVTPYLLVFSNQDEVVGIFPWVKQRFSRMGIPYYHIGSIYHDHVNLSDVIYDPAYQQSISELFDVFVKALPLNSIVVMHDVRDDSQFIRLLPSLSSRAFVTEYGESFYIDFNEEIDAHLPKRMVKNVKRLLRKANDTGQVEFKFLSDGEITKEAFEDFLTVESSGWKGQAGTETAIRLNPELKEYYQYFLDAMPLKMQLNLFYLNDSPIAAHYCFKDEHYLSLAKVGYIEEHKALSPSHVLIYKAIENAGVIGRESRISFVTGASWLGQWHPNSAKLSTVHISTSLLASMILKAMKSVKTFKTEMKRRLSKS
ncbi:MAG: GNAT family N-acetyltransferase [Cellvibrionaceae bacterium]